MSVKDQVKKLIGFLGYEISHKIINTPNYIVRDSKTLIAGPFMGEFGWEVMQWQGYIRWLSKFYEKTIIHTRKSSSFLYDDFAHEVITIDSNSYNTSGYVLDGFDYDEWVSNVLRKTDADILVADKRARLLKDYFHQDFRNIEKNQGRIKKRVLIHARKIPAFTNSIEKSLRNWPGDKWQQLLEMMADYEVIAIGHEKQSIAPTGAKDMRGVSSDITEDLMKSSSLIVGPSSGAIHLASLYGLPHVTWTSSKQDMKFGGGKFRYERSWNPHGTACIVIENDNWDPSAYDVLSAIQRLEKC